MNYFEVNLFSDHFAEHFEKEISDGLANKLLADDKSKGTTLWSSSEVMVCCLYFIMLLISSGESLLKICSLRALCSDVAHVLCKLTMPS